MTGGIDPNTSSLDEAWDKICYAFPILTDKDGSRCSSDEFNDIATGIASLGTDMVESMVLDKITHLLQRIIVPEFWRRFSCRDTDSNGPKAFQESVDKLYNTLTTLVPVLERLDTLRQISGSHRTVYGEHSLMATFKIMLRSALYAQLPLNYKTITEDFYKISFEVFCNAENVDKDANDSGEDVVQCAGCGNEIDNCECLSILRVFHETNRKLQELELLERLAGEVLTKLIHHRIESHVQETCKGSFDTSYITSLENPMVTSTHFFGDFNAGKRSRMALGVHGVRIDTTILWLRTVVMGWLTRIYEGYPKESKHPQTPITPSNTAGINDYESKSTASTLIKLQQTLQHFLYETYTRTRIDQLFNIIIEYPESEPAIDDLRVCLKKTDMRSYLTRKIQHALETRLLHPGVNTPDILTAYVAAIRALRTLDPTGVLLETVTHPVRQYLRRRDDTVRCVVTSLTEDGPSDLAEELARGDALNLDENSPTDEDSENWEFWMPDPVDADPSKTSKSRRTSDIISMLVNVYGSKELFVNEYRTLLADRLLSQFSYNTDKEIRYLELLKLRFGESQLHYCDVMLRDIYDSKRINSHLHSEPSFNLDKQQFNTMAMILSAQFWPPFNKETLELPAFVQEHLDTYTKAFETFKGNRTLCWKPQLGSVNLEIELKDRKLNLTVSPIHATIIWHFQSKNQWTIDELSQVMKTPATVIRRKITYWQSQGILREVAADTLLLIEDNYQKGRATLHSDMVCEEEETESAMASAHDQREEELQVFWTYIVGMLTNLDSMPLERILQMLKMFASQGPTVECTNQELRHFLDRKVREHELVFSGGFYRLPKP